MLHFKDFDGERFTKLNTVYVKNRIPEYLKKYKNIYEIRIDHIGARKYIIYGRKK
jgi:hypothetical protein